MRKEEEKRASKGEKDIHTSKKSSRKRSLKLDDAIKLSLTAEGTNTAN